MLHFIWVLLIGAIIGSVAGWLTNRGGSMSWIANIIAGLIGSALGEHILGFWGPVVAGMAIIPSVIGAVILVLIVSVLLRILIK